MNQETSVILQGPLHSNTAQAVNNYFNYVDNIVVSFWNTDDKMLLETIANKEQLIASGRLLFVENEYHINPNAFNLDNVYYQVYSTLKACEKVHTKYCIKLRTDQYYENLTHILELLVSHECKYICSNQHVRSDDMYKFHASDNIIAMSTDVMIKTFRISYERLVRNAFVLMSGAYMYTDDATILTPALFQKYINYKRTGAQFVTKYPDKPQIHTVQVLPHHGIGVTPEQLITTSYFLAKRLLPAPEDSRELMKLHVHIFKVELLGAHMNKRGGTEVIRSFVQEIHDINDI